MGDEASGTVWAGSPNDWLPTRSGSLGIDPRTVEEALSYSLPPGYVRSGLRSAEARSVLGMIDRFLERIRISEEATSHPKPRFERLRDEYGFTGKITIVKDYICGVRQRRREMFVPLTHPPGHAQVDFGEALAVIGGVERTIHFLAMSLPHSDACFVKAYPGETTEAFCDGHVSSSPSSAVCRARSFRTTPGLLWPASSVTASVSGHVYQRVTIVLRCSRTLCRPGKGNTGKVEGIVGYCRRNSRRRFRNFDDRRLKPARTMGDNCRPRVGRLEAILRSPRLLRQAIGSVRCRWCAIAADLRPQRFGQGRGHRAAEVIAAPAFNQLWTSLRHHPTSRSLSASSDVAGHPATAGWSKPPGRPGAIAMFSRSIDGARLHGHSGCRIKAAIRSPAATLGGLHGATIRIAARSTPRRTIASCSPNTGWSAPHGRAADQDAKGPSKADSSTSKPTHTTTPKRRALSKRSRSRRCT